MNNLAVGKKLKRKCPLCLHDNGNRLGILDFALFDDSPLERHVEVVSCNKCGFVFYDTSCSENQYRDFYVGNYFMSNYKVDSVVVNDYFSKTSGIIKHYVQSPNARICDIGCGNGEMLLALKRDGYENLCGTDYHLSSESFSSIGIEAYNGNIYDLPLREDSCDLVLSSQVFEHLVDLKSAARSIWKTLKDNGYLYVEVPDAARYNLYRGLKPRDLFMVEHINHFDLFHLKSLFSQEGYTLCEAGNRIRGSGEIYSYAVIYCIFRKTTSSEDCTTGAEFSLSENVFRWFNYGEYLEELMKQSVYVWGISYRTMHVLAQKPYDRANIKGLVDSNTGKHGKTINGIPVRSPEILKQCGKNDVVLIATCPSAFAMYSQLINDYGFKGTVILL
jgi:SAM-dependent methyltransferase